MLHAEYVRSLNCNYERILLEKRPEEKRYQYCILNRGGIKGLLPCSLRYINGVAYLYYDISSRQTISQLYGDRSITRGWMRDFMWSLKQIQQELSRFLLDMGNILWYPEQVFQDLENNFFSFLYFPYYEGEASFIRLVEFWAEHIDYEDELLVSYVYRMYEQLERNGELYLQSRIFEDAECLGDFGGQNAAGHTGEQSCAGKQNFAGKAGDTPRTEEAEADAALRAEEPGEIGRKEERSHARNISLFSLFEGRKNRGKKLREEYNLTMQQVMSGYAVAEETPYEAEDFGRTIFVEDKPDEAECVHRLYTPEGKLLASLEQSRLSIGKKKGEVDLVLDDASVSRMHACIAADEGGIYLEDMNSTNGTFKNGLRLQPYEKRKLEAGDEIKCGKVRLVFQ